MNETRGKVVCVTGASGFIASWIVKFLLQRGYTVRATVRDKGNPKKVSHLANLEGAKERLHLFKADLLEEGSFDSVVEGCHAVFHTASPVRFVVNNPQAELIDPAVKGTLNVLKSCAKSPSVKRVVLTSSISAVAFTGKPKTPEVVVDETWFSDPDFCRESELWYTLSKTLAEEAAWKFVNENNIDMIVINPTMVAGPLLQAEINESVEPILNLINENKQTNLEAGYFVCGDEGLELLGLAHRYIMGAGVQFCQGKPFLNRSFGWVNVKDVANAHILAYEIASASGRYCLSERVIHYSELARTLRDLYPTFQIPDKCEVDEPYMPTYQISTDKAKKDFGIEFTPLEVSVRETVESFKEKKIINF